jgi:acetoacetate decarboxylase
MCPYDDCTTIELSYVTDETRLRQYIPEEFTITRPVLLIMYEKCNGVQWMGGSQYSLIAVSVQVQYTAGSEPIDGVYHLVLWKTRPSPSSAGARRRVCPRSLLISQNIAG